MSTCSWPGESSGADVKSSLLNWRNEGTIGQGTKPLNQHTRDKNMKTETAAIDIDRGKGDFFYPEAHVRDAGVGLSEQTIHYIADVKDDPDWVREYRLRRLQTFLEKPIRT